MLKRLIMCLLPISAMAFDAAKPGLIPTPQEVKWKDSTVKISKVDLKFNVKNKTDELAFLQQRLAEIMKENRLRPGRGYRIVLEQTEVEAPYQKDEAYTLSTGTREAVIKANTVRGLFYGVATLRQLISRQGKHTQIALAEINDFPAFKIRGYMHDVGRNFLTLDLLKKQVDIMSEYKYNVFHWHLTEYHGWRLESKIYPGLQEDHAFQRFTGKYYTQQEFVEFVNYCRLRQITVIPEFDSPGHSDAFRAGIGVKNMKDPRAKEAMIKLIDELCALVPKELMPYIHLGTDEVRGAAEQVNADYVPALYAAVRKNGRQPIGWWHGIKGDESQIQQTWAQYKPMKGRRHIDSRSNYVNHLDHLNFLTRILFQQPCDAPHGDAQNLGGILAYWPDTYAPDQDVNMLNAPVWTSIVAYPEAVWTGVKEPSRKHWAVNPDIHSPEGKRLIDFENRMVEHRERFHHDFPFMYVKNAQQPWRILGPINEADLMDLPKTPVKPSYQVGSETFNWDKQVYGGMVELRHPFGFGGHFASVKPAGKKVYAFTRIYSPKDQTVGFWINFNTVSASDDRAGRLVQGQWNRNKHCKVWVNGAEMQPPQWKSSGKTGKEVPIVDEVYTNRAPYPIQLKKGWNDVLISAASAYKWHFVFTPVQIHGQTAREVPGLKFSAELPK